MKIVVEEIFFKFRWYIRIIYVLIIIGLLLLLLPLSSVPLRKEKLFAETFLGLLKKNDEINLNDGLVLFNNHEFFFKYSDYGDVFCVTENGNANRLSSHIAGRVWDQENSSTVYFIIATDKDKTFHQDSVEFVRQIRSRSVEENLKKIRELESNAERIGDIVLTMEVKLDEKNIAQGDKDDEKIED